MNESDMRRILKDESAAKWSARLRAQKAEDAAYVLTDALQFIADNAECSFGLGANVKHGGFCAYHTALEALNQLSWQRDEADC